MAKKILALVAQPLSAHALRSPVGEEEADSAEELVVGPALYTKKRFLPPGPHFPPELLSARRECTVSVCVPARDEAATIGPIVESLVRLGERGVVDQVVVVDASRDGTGEIARRLGAEVHAQADLMPSFGPVL